MKPKMLFTIFLILLIMSFIPIYPNPRKPHIPFINPKRVNLWRAMS